MELTFQFSFLDGSRKMLKNPVSFSCLSSTDTPAESLKAVFMVNDPGIWKQEMDSVLVQMGEKLLFQGKCDRQIVSLSQQGCRLTIWARSLAAALLDNEAIPQEYHNISVNEVFDKHIKPYGFRNDLGVTGRMASSDEDYPDQSFWPSFVAGLHAYVPASAYPYLNNPGKVSGVWQHGLLTLWTDTRFTQAMLNKPAVVDGVKKAAANTFGGHPNVRVVVGKPPVDAAPAQGMGKVSVPPPAPEKDALDELLAFGAQFDNIIIK